MKFGLIHCMFYFSFFYGDMKEYKTAVSMETTLTYIGTYEYMEVYICTYHRLYTYLTYLHLYLSHRTFLAEDAPLRIHTSNQQQTTSIPFEKQHTVDDLNDTYISIVAYVFR